MLELVSECRTAGCGNPVAGVSRGGVEAEGRTAGNGSPVAGGIRVRFVNVHIFPNLTRQEQRRQFASVARACGSFPDLLSFAIGDWNFTLAEEGRTDLCS
eukprot:7665589-Lingulodinium_polyedra.AAC.1